MRRTKARSEWSCFGKKIQSKLRNSQSSLPENHLLVYNFIQRPRDVIEYNHCSHLLQLIPQLVAKISSSSSHENFFPLKHTNIHLQLTFLTQIFLPPCNERACIQPAATYFRYAMGKIRRVV